MDYMLKGIVKNNQQNLNNCYRLVDLQLLEIPKDIV